LVTKQNILGINTEFKSLQIKNFDEYYFTSDLSFLDYDAIVISTDFICTNYSESSRSPFQNKRLLSETASNQLKGDFKKIKEQIIELLKQGKNIYVLMGNNENCYIYTGEKQYSGIGKNARQTNIVNEFDMYSFLPIKLSATHVYGEKVEDYAKQPYTDFFKKTRGCFHYAAYFNCNQQNILMKIPQTDKAISAVFEYEKGKIILLPLPYNKDEYKEDQYWKKNGKTYIDELFKLNEKLYGFSDEYTLPSWADGFSILGEKEELNKLKNEQEKLNKLKKSIEKQGHIISEIQHYKTLVTSSGNQLEEIVKLVLSELGFKLFEVEPGRSDIIAQYNDINVVAEVKGVTKSAAEKHAAQLEKWVAHFIEENEHSPKPILIVNGFYETPLFERTEDVFPNQMLKYSKARNHCLITTSQLLCLYIDIRQNPEQAEAKIDELLKTIGKYTHYDNIEEYILRNKQEDIAVIYTQIDDKGFEQTESSANII
jgi:prophage antirepressor-like protein